MMVQVGFWQAAETKPGAVDHEQVLHVVGLLERS